MALKLDVRNILNVLHDRDVDFADADWELLGQQLLRRSQLRTIRADRHGDPSLCLIDTASTWLQTDLNASWERLAEAIEQVAIYGEKTANTIRQKAGIPVAPGRAQPLAASKQVTLPTSKPAAKHSKVLGK